VNNNNNNDANQIEDTVDFDNYEDDFEEYEEDFEDYESDDGDANRLTLKASDNEMAKVVDLYKEKLNMKNDKN